MKKLKPLLPTLKEKKRYLAFEIISEAKIKSFHAVNDCIMDAALTYLGTKGTAEAGIMVLKDLYQASSQRGLLRVNNKNLTNARTALTFIETIEEKKVIVHSLGASGVLKKAKTYLGG